VVTETPLDVTIPLKPAYSDTVTDTNLGMIGVVISGAQMFNDYEDPTRTFIAVDDNFTVDGVAFVDSCNAHPLALNVGGGNYHYHGIPYCITDGIDVAGEHSHILGFLLDGFPLYGPQGTDGSKLVTGDLDECNAHFGPTPEFPNGIYHYHLKEDKSPYTPDCYHGEVTVAGNSGGGPPVAALPVAVRPGPPVDEPVTQRAVGASGSVSPGCCRSLSLCGSGSLCGSSRSTAVTALRLCSQTRKPISCSTSR
jgi:YHYH protein